MKIKAINKNNEKTLTLDLEVNGSHTYQLSNKVVTHNTSSLVLGTSSGIHAWFAKYYIRRMRIGKNETLYRYLIANHPQLIVDDYFRPHDTAIIEVPQKSPVNAITRDESIFAFLSRIKKFNTKWVYGGHRKGENFNNVSATVFIKDNELGIKI